MSVPPVPAPPVPDHPARVLRPALIRALRLDDTGDRTQLDRLASAAARVATDPNRALVEVRCTPDGDDELLEIVTWDHPLLYRTTRRVLAASARTVRAEQHPIIGIVHQDGVVDGTCSPRDAEAAIAVGVYRLAPDPGEDLSAASVDATDATRTDAAGDIDTGIDADTDTDTRDQGPAPAPEPALIRRLRARLLAVTRAGIDRKEMRQQLAAALHTAPLPGVPDDSSALIGLLDLVDAGHLRLLATCTSDAAAGGAGLATTAEAAARPWWPGAALAWNEQRLREGRLAPHAVTRAVEHSPIGPAERLVVLSTRTEDEIAHAIMVPDPEAERLAPRRLLLSARLTPILEREELADDAYEAQALLGLAAAFPLDEVLRSTTDELHELLHAFRRAEGRGELLVRVRRGPGPRGRTVLLGLPQRYADASLADRLRAAIAATLRADRSDVQVASDARAQTVVRVQVWDTEDPGDDDACRAALQHAVEHALAGWLARAADAVERADLDVDRDLLARTVLPRLPRGYQDAVAADQAPRDLALLTAVVDADPGSFAVDLQPLDARRGWVSLARAGRATEPSTLVPVLESFGFRVVDATTYPLRGGGPEVTLQRLAVTAPGSLALDELDEPGQQRVLAAIDAALDGRLELDAMNALVLSAGITWHDVALLRAYRRLRRQLGTTYTPAYVDRALVDNPAVVHAIVEVIHARFEPGRATADLDRAHGVLDTALGQLTRLDHDRILRGLATLIDATLRTNAFQTRPEGEPPTLALKIDPSRIPDLPRPVPYREIFVHSPTLEGVHLRAGAVARGGLRWSDREDDVRTEVLDLLRAQVLKNAVIVPSGAKGGFVVKDLPEDPTARPAHVAATYDRFIGALLDVTDDLDGDTVVPPREVVRHDGDDPYLVVAADRGTATFSDRANAIALDRGFWLGDAFASGGSQGYDHKALGVTARGAWVAVARHFAERGVDVSTEAIDIIGIGDMSGDVFGNGLLRSRAVRLVAAFDHRHIMIDPDPDPAATFTERQRLFDLPRSTWDDLDRSVLSTGAMIVPRDVSRVELTDEVRALLRIDATTLAPPELIRAVLQAPADLLFAGGIGTYVKASHERHEDLGDRANDEIRVDASELRVRVVGEGANLAITPAARLEFARHGGAINQDAVDNAAGVATSDLEVNLKILLRAAEEDGDLEADQRDALLQHLSDEVVEEVLGVVDRQAAGISREARRRPGHLEPVRALLDDLIARHDLDPAVETLPDDAELQRRATADAGLSRPEIASLVAWVKRDLSEQLLASTVPDRSSMTQVLREAVVPGVRDRFPTALARHRLRRELIATRLSNTLVDRLGPTVIRELGDDTGREDVEVAAALETARRCIDADRWWALLDQLEQEQGPDRVRELEPPLERLLRGLARARLALPSEPQEGLIAAWARTADVLIADGHEFGSESARRARDAHARWLIDDLVEPELARRLAAVPPLTWIADIAASHARLHDEGTVIGIADVADLVLRTVDRFGFDRLEESLGHVPGGRRWTRHQRIGLTEDLRRLVRRIARRSAVLAPGDPAAAIEAFVAAGGAPLQAAQHDILVAADATEERLDAAAVALRRLAAALDPTR